MTPDFITQIRKKVGTDRLQLVSVSGVALNDQQEVLLQLRSDTKNWAMISGVLEPDEQPAECLQREFKEETGVEITVLGIASLHVEPEQVYQNGDRAQFLNITFLVEPKGVPKVSDSESLDVQWFPLAELPELSFNNRRRLQDALRYKQTNESSIQ